jgi:hypothetical protein
MASSPASKAFSRTIALKPLCAGVGPQKSSLTMSDVTRPSRSALVTAYSARLMRSSGTPL